jgi:hypothetical protein
LTRARCASCDVRGDWARLDWARVSRRWLCPTCKRRVSLLPDGTLSQPRAVAEPAAAAPAQHAPSGSTSRGGKCTCGDCRARRGGVVPSQGLPWRRRPDPIPPAYLDLRIRGCDDCANRTTVKEESS